MGGLRQLQKAQAGGHGGPQKRIGKHGTDKVIQVGSIAASFSCCQTVVLGLLPRADIHQS